MSSISSSPSFPSLPSPTCFLYASLSTPELTLLFYLSLVRSQFATLTFVFICDQAESELGVLDLIQVFVEALDRMFENVCELDLVFGFDEVSSIISIYSSISSKLGS